MPPKVLKSRRFKIGDPLHLSEAVDVECQTDFYDEAFDRSVREINELKGSTAEEINAPKGSTIKESGSIQQEEVLKNPNILYLQLKTCMQIISKLSSDIKKSRKENEKIISFFGEIFRLVRAMRSEYDSTFLNVQDNVKAMSCDMDRYVKDVLEFLSKQKGVFDDERKRLKNSLKGKDVQIAHLQEKLATSTNNLKSVMLALEAQQRRISISERNAHAAREEMKDVNSKLNDQLFLAGNQKCISCQANEKVREMLSDEIAEKTNNLNIMNQKLYDMDSQLTQQKRVNGILSKAVEKHSFSEKAYRGEFERMKAEYETLLIENRHLKNVAKLNAESAVTNIPSTVITPPDSSSDKSSKDDSGHTETSSAGLIQSTSKDISSPISCHGFSQRAPKHHNNECIDALVEKSAKFAKNCEIKEEPGLPFCDKPNSKSQQNRPQFKEVLRINKSLVVGERNNKSLDKSTQQRQPHFGKSLENRPKSIVGSANTLDSILPSTINCNRNNNNNVTFGETLTVSNESCNNKRPTDDCLITPPITTTIVKQDVESPENDNREIELKTPPLVALAANREKNSVKSIPSSVTTLNAIDFAEDHIEEINFSDLVDHQPSIVVPSDSKKALQNEINSKSNEVQSKNLVLSSSSSVLDKKSSNTNSVPGKEKRTNNKGNDKPTSSKKNRRRARRRSSSQKAFAANDFDLSQRRLIEMRTVPPKTQWSGQFFDHNSPVTGGPTPLFGRRVAAPDDPHTRQLAAIQQQQLEKQAYEQQLCEQQIRREQQLQQIQRMRECQMVPQSNAVQFRRCAGATIDDVIKVDRLIGNARVSNKPCPSTNPMHNAGFVRAPDSAPVRRVPGDAFNNNIVMQRSPIQRSGLFDMHYSATQRNLIRPNGSPFIAQESPNINSSNNFGRTSSLPWHNRGGGGDPSFTNFATSSSWVKR